MCSVSWLLCGPPRGGGRILRCTLSVRLSVRPVIERHVAPPSELQWHTCTFRHALRAAYRTAISAAQILVLVRFQVAVQVTDWKVSEMTYKVLMGTLNPTNSLTPLLYPIAWSNGRLFATAGWHSKATSASDQQAACHLVLHVIIHSKWRDSSCNDGCLPTTASGKAITGH